MLALDQIGIEFGGRWLLRDASYQFRPGERIGLIGRNGAGKSTLLRLIAGEMSASEGQIHRAGQLKVAFFNQDLLSYETQRSIYDVARDAFAPLLALRDEIRDLLHRLEQGADDPALLDELAHKQDAFETGGGTKIDAAVHSVLSGLGFAPHEHEAPYHIFSGGWRMRVLLARMLLADPDVLLLDEPTNHLDLPSIQWLENYLKSFRGACIVVSHDRFFIDRIASRILEIGLQQLNVYSGNYSFYLKEKALRQEQLQRAYENQQKFIEDQERFINRFRAKATKARQVQSRIKQLDKVDRLLAPEEEVSKLNIRFKVRTTPGKEVLRLRDIGKAYGDKVILQQTSATVMRGDKIALIGANGLGKSTLLRIMAATDTFEGSRELGHNVELSFFAQHQLEALDLRRNIYDEVAATVRDKTEAEIRNILGCFMFSGDDTEKKIQVLSGGERSRVALAKTLMAEANFLVLDEPTNHLDIASIDILVEALQAYEGTYVVVSHDRFFLERISTKVWYIEDRKICEYPGSYDEYAAWKARQEAASAASVRSAQQQEKEKEKERKAAEPAVTSGGGPDYGQRKAMRNRLRKLEREQEEVEARIETLETHLRALEGRMADPAVAADFAALSEVQTQYETVRRQLDEATAAWESVLLTIEQLQTEIGEG
ncbi:MAG: ABC-F family ATP-binding cassette domain-containing protein [Bacteroidia bacterium]